MGQTPDNPADMTILVKTFRTTVCKVGYLIVPELVNLPDCDG